MNDVLGIGDLGFYTPDPRMDLDRLLEGRKKTHPELTQLLKKASKKTGLMSFRFPEIWEDSASMAANAAAAVLDRLGTDSRLRYLVSGTETAVDHAKPVASYVQGMLENAGYPIKRNLLTFDVKHACAGGSMGMLAATALLANSGTSGDRALVTSSDIARYEAPSTAEITQGAGAAAVLLERNPALMSLDLMHQGRYSSDVDDFFRPLDSHTARVKGRYSMECYQEALERAFLDYCDQKELRPRDLMDSIDYLVFHVPFPRMPETALRKLLMKTCGFNTAEIESTLNRMGFVDALQINAALGNLYTGSLFVYLMSLLRREAEKLKDRIVGKSILFASYGSGNTMVVFSGTLRSGAPKIIERWSELHSRGRKADFNEYLKWLDHSEDPASWNRLLQNAHPPSGRFHLKNFDASKLRIYGRA